MNVLLSIKPKYVKLILSGEKKYEFRKQIFTRYSDIQNVYIYSTSPVKKIVGFFAIKNIVKDKPTKLWEMFKNLSGVTKEEFFQYFLNYEEGFAIEINKLKILETPLDPNELIPDFRAPQSFMYIEHNDLAENHN